MVGSSRTVVLCLHGCRQDRHVFLDKSASLLQLKTPIPAPQEATGQEMSGWVTSEGVDCFFIDAPFTLPKAEGDEVCMRTWKGDAADHVITGPLGGPAATAMIPPDYQRSVQLVLDTIEELCQHHQSSTATNSDIDVGVKLLGYSEGCIVATFVGMLLAAAPHHCPIELQGLLLLSPPAIPNITDGMSFVLLPTIALIGEVDDIVPPTVSRDLLSSLFIDVTILTHSGGHSVPSGNVPTRSAIATFMAPTTSASASPPVAEAAPSRKSPPAAQQHQVRGGVLTAVEDVEELLMECECVANVTCTESTRDEGPLVSMFDQGERFAVAVRDGDEAALQGLVSQYGGVVVVGPAYQGRAAAVMIPLLTKGAVREAAGDNVPPHRMKQLLEAGEFVVMQVVVPIPGYPYDLPALSCTIAAGVPSELRRGRALRAVEADAVKLCREGVGSEMLLQLCMGVSDPVLKVLEEFYRNGDVDGDADEGVEGNAVCHHETSQKSQVQAEESRRAKLALLWEGVDDEDEATREARIHAGQAAAVALLSNAAAGGASGGVSWREAYSGLRSTRGGQWNITMGLVGKPSAGKSSFFNAATESDAAKVGAFPFTTIEPNIAPALAPIPCPCALVKLDDGQDGACLRSVEHPCAAPYGCDLDTCLSHSRRMRRHPVRLKDVAGLVKGAYTGRGKGNQFLNDLCDADVLVHIIDGVGATDAEGRSCPVGEGDPLSDVGWVRNEIHSWIYDNARAHWSTVRRRPNILPYKFTGYGASVAMMQAVLEAVGLGTPQQMNSKIPNWTPDDLHIFVAVFIAIRFPMVMAVNKADIDHQRAITNAIRIAVKNPLDLVCVLSARFEGKVIGQGEGDVFRKSLMERVEAESTAMGVSVTASGMYAGVRGVLYAGCMAANPLCLFLEDSLEPYFHSQPDPSGPYRPLTLTTAEKRLSCCAHCFLVRRRTTVDAAKTAVFGFPANRKVVRCEGLNLYNLHPSLSTPSTTPPTITTLTATNVKRGAGVYKDAVAVCSSGDMYADVAPTVHSKLKEFDSNCILRIMTNSKGSAAR